MAMNDEERKFMMDCDVFRDYTSIEEYKADIRRYLTLSSWHYSEEMADEIVTTNDILIDRAFAENEPAADIAVDIGYSCG